MELLLQRMLPRFSKVLNSYKRRNQYHYLFFSCCAEFTYAYRKYLIATSLQSIFDTQVAHIVPHNPASSPVHSSPSLIKFLLDQECKELSRDQESHNPGRLDGIFQALQATFTLMVEFEPTFPKNLWHKDKAFSDGVLLIYECLFCLQFDLSLDEYTDVAASSMQVYYLDRDISSRLSGITALAARESIIAQLKIQLSAGDSLNHSDLVRIINFLNDEFTVLRGSRFASAISKLQARADYKQLAAEEFAYSPSIVSPFQVECGSDSSDDGYMAGCEQDNVTPSVVGSIATPELSPRYESFISRNSGGMMLMQYAVGAGNVLRYEGSESGSSAHGSRLCRPEAPPPAHSPRQFPGIL